MRENVANIEVMTEILDNIKKYNRIIIFRHFRPDGDAIGSTKGLREILRLTYPQKDIRLINCDTSEYLAFLGDGGNRRITFGHSPLVGQPHRTETGFAEQGDEGLFR